MGCGQAREGRMGGVGSVAGSELPRLNRTQGSADLSGRRKSGLIPTNLSFWPKKRPKPADLISPLSR